MRRCAAFSLATCLTASVFGVTSVSAAAAPGPSSTYIVVLDDEASLTSAVADERRRGNTILDTFSAGSDGFVASLDASDVSRLKTDPDVRIVERDRLVSLSDPTDVASRQADVVANASPGDVIPGRYIVSLKSGADMQSLVATFSDRISRRFSQALNGFVVDLTEAEADALASDPSVANVEQDSVVGLVADQTGATWGLDRIDQRVLPLNQKYSYAGDGTGSLRTSSTRVSVRLTSK